MVEGVTVLNPPEHALVLKSSDQEVRYVNVFAPPSQLDDDSLESHNTDAADVHGGATWIHDVNFTTGDDNVAIHSSDVVVENSYFGTGHGASIGSLGDGTKIKNITIKNITFHGTTAGFRIKTDCEASGYVKQVTVKDCEMYDVGTTIEFDMHYQCDDDGSGKSSIDLYDFTFKNINAYGTKDSAGIFDCQKNAPCHDITLTDVKHHSSEKGVQMSCQHAYGTTKNVTPDPCLKD